MSDETDLKIATDTSCPQSTMTDEEKIDAAAAEILERYRDAFLELAK